MQNKIILMILLSIVVVNMGFAIEPQSGKWQMTGSGTWNSDDPGETLIVFRVSDDRQLLTIEKIEITVTNNKDPRMVFEMNIKPNEAEIHDGKISFWDDRYKGIFDSKTTAHGTWMFESSGHEVRKEIDGKTTEMTWQIEGTWIASYVGEMNKFVLKNVASQKSISLVSRLVVTAGVLENAPDHLKTIKYVVQDNDGKQEAGYRWVIANKKPSRKVKSLVITRAGVSFDIPISEPNIARGFLAFVENMGDIEDVELTKAFGSVITPSVLSVGSELIFKTNVKFFGHHIDSDNKYPMVFKMVKDLGFTY